MSKLKSCNKKISRQYRNKARRHMESSIRARPSVLVKHPCHAPEIRGARKQRVTSMKLTNECWKEHLKLSTIHDFQITVCERQGISPQAPKVDPAGVVTSGRGNSIEMVTYSATDENLRNDRLVL